MALVLNKYKRNRASAPGRILPRGDANANFVKRATYNVGRRMTHKDFEERDRLLNPGHATHTTLCLNCSQAISNANGGDHIFELCGYAKATGMYGAHTSWNINPFVCSRCNKTYKLVKRGKKTIADLGLVLFGYGTLAEEDQEQLTAQQRRVKTQLKQWIAYAEANHASMYVPSAKYTADFTAMQDEIDEVSRKWGERADIARSVGSAAVLGS